MARVVYVMPVTGYLQVFALSNASPVVLVRTM